MIKSIKESMRAAAAMLPVAALVLTCLLVVPGTGQAVEIIPSVGLSKATDAHAGDANYSVGLALRTSVLPLLKLEGGISYRQDDFFSQSLKVRMWPVTVSGWLTPSPMLYAGGGLGWYRTTYDYTNPGANSDWTTNQLGVHVGGGFRMPIAPGLALDLNGRYIFMQKHNELALPSTFNPDFWNASLGVSFQL